MEAIAVSKTPTQAPAKPRRWPVWLSRSASAVFVLFYFFVYPLCYCPRYYLELSVIGLVPLILGPRLYRFLGVAILVTGLLSSEADRRGRIREQQQLDEMRSHMTLEQQRNYPSRAHP